jgi:hypothetical protein
MPIEQKIVLGICVAIIILYKLLGGEWPWNILKNDDD